MYTEAQIERLKRATNLADLASSYGYEIDGRNGKSRTSLRMRHFGTKIIVATDKDDGHGIFFYVDGSGGGSVIDFVMKEDSLNFGQACRKLEEWLNIPSSFPTAYTRLPKPEPITRNRAKVIVEWEGMRPYKPGYLEGRGLRPETITRFADSIRTGGKYNNTCFLHKDETGVTGFEVKNKGGFHGFAGGGEKALFLCQVGEVRDTSECCIVIAESAIDAMSYYQLHPSDGVYMSIAGGLNPTQPELLRRTLARYPHATVFIATDNDLPTGQHPKPEGEHYYEVIRELCPPTATVIRAMPPEPYKDWNDVLTGRPRQPKKDERSHAGRIAGERRLAREREHTP